MRNGLILLTCILFLGFKAYSLKLQNDKLIEENEKLSKAQCHISDTTAQLSECQDKINECLQKYDTLEKINEATNDRVGDLIDSGKLSPTDLK